MAQPRKRFGQHFLHDAGVLQRFATACDLSPDDGVLEIGPGQGALTDVLIADEVARYRAIEIDRDLIPWLKARYSSQRYPYFEVINEDVLRADLLAHTAEPLTWRIVGNLPYNISSPLIVKLAQLFRDSEDGTSRIRDGHFMLQREMAERLAAVPGNKSWGRLSVVAQLVFQVDHLFDVDPECFRPPPRVWSSVVRMQRLPQPVQVADYTVLDDVVRRAFSARRKRLSNALKIFAFDWDQLAIDPGERADNVSVADFVALANFVSAQKA